MSNSAAQEYFVSFEPLSEMKHFIMVLTHSLNFGLDYLNDWFAVIAAVLRSDPLKSITGVTFITAEQISHGTGVCTGRMHLQSFVNERTDLMDVSEIGADRSLAD